MEFERRYINGMLMTFAILIGSLLIIIIYQYSQFLGKSEYLKYEGSISYIVNIIKKVVFYYERVKVLSLKPFKVIVYNPFNTTVISCISVQISSSEPYPMYVNLKHSKTLEPGFSIITLNITPIGNSQILISLESPIKLFMPVSALGDKPSYRLDKLIMDLLPENIRLKLEAIYPLSHEISITYGLK